jgi:hypothetical protein
MANEDTYVITIEGERITIELSKHTLERCEEREITKYEVYSLILKMGEKLLDLKNGEQFAIVDKEAGIGIINQITCDSGDIYIDVITAISNENIWISRGTKVVNVSELFEDVN